MLWTSQQDNGSQPATPSSIPSSIFCFSTFHPNEAEMEGIGCNDDRQWMYPIRSKFILCFERRRSCFRLGFSTAQVKVLLLEDILREISLFKKLKNITLRKVMATEEPLLNTFADDSDALRERSAVLRPCQIAFTRTTSLYAYQTIWSRMAWCDGRFLVWC